MGSGGGDVRVCLYTGRCFTATSVSPRRPADFAPSLGVVCEWGPSMPPGFCWGGRGGRRGGMTGCLPCCPRTSGNAFRRAPAEGGPARAGLAVCAQNLCKFPHKPGTSLSVWFSAPGPELIGDHMGVPWAQRGKRWPGAASPRKGTEIHRDVAVFQMRQRNAASPIAGPHLPPSPPAEIPPGMLEKVPPSLRLPLCSACLEASLLALQPSPPLFKVKNAGVSSTWPLPRRKVRRAPGPPSPLVGDQGSQSFLLPTPPRFLWLFE